MGTRKKKEKERLGEEKGGKKKESREGIDGRMRKDGEILRRKK